MQIKLNNLPSLANQTVIAKFATFTKDQKYQFFAYFYNMLEEARWIRMDFQYSRVVSGNVQQYTLVDIWKDEILMDYKSFRTFDFLEGFNRFKYIRSYEFEHVRYLHGKNGAHWIEYMMSPSNPTGRFEVITHPSIAVNLRSRLEIVDDHYLYENLYYKNPNGPINIDGVMYSKKSEHYIVNPNWSEEKLIHEMSYAWANKRLFIRKPAVNQSLLGTQYPVVEEKFVSNFSNGTKIEFTVRSHQVDPVTNTLKYNHLGLMAIIK